MGDGLIELSATGQKATETVVRLGVVGLDLQCLAVMRDGLVNVAATLHGAAKAVLGHGDSAALVLEGRHVIHFFFLDDFMPLGTQLVVVLRQLRLVLGQLPLLIADLLRVAVAPKVVVPLDCVKAEPVMLAVVTVVGAEIDSAGRLSVAFPWGPNCCWLSRDRTVAQLRD